ncbi:MAG: replication initiation protein RepC [Candidatus Puniceispirillales bacterium WSBS_2018_MAG_OTU23]
MGQAAAALIVIIIEVKHHRGIVRSPGGYLRGMMKKSRKGLLHLGENVG